MSSRRRFGFASETGRRTPIGAFFLATQLASVCILSMSCGQAVDRPGPDSSTENDRLRIRAAELMRLEREITLEYPLARHPKPYMVVNLPAGSVELRACGRKLRSFRILDTRHPGEALHEDAPWSIIDRKPLQDTERTRIQPGAGQEGVVEVVSQEPWGPHRMPWDYDLRCDGGRVLEIRSLPSEDSGSRVVRGLKTLYRQAADRIRHWMSPGQGGDRALQIWLSERDSQLLFWSLPKGIKILIVGDACSSKAAQGRGTEPGAKRK